MNSQELLPFYALDAVTEEERAFIEAQLAQDPSLRAELDELQAAADAIALSVAPMMPSPASKRQLLDRIDRALVSSVSPAVAEPGASWLERLLAAWRTRWAMPAAGVSVALAGLALVWAFMLSGQLEALRAELARSAQEVGMLQTTVASKDAELARLNLEIAALSAEIDAISTINVTQQTQLDFKNEQLAFYNDPNLVHIDVPSTGLRERASGMFSIDPQNDLSALWVWGLDQLDADETYQIWYIDDQGIEGGSLFNVGDDGRAWLVFDSAEIPSYTTIGVSIEPAGGSQTPSDQIILLGSS